MFAPPLHLFFFPTKARPKKKKAPKSRNGNKNLKMTFFFFGKVPPRRPFGFFFMSQTNTLTGAVIKLTAGTYTVPLLHGVPPPSLLTIQGTGCQRRPTYPSEHSSLALSGKTVVVDSVTIDASKGGTLTVSTPIGGAGTVSNSMLKGGDLTMNNTGHLHRTSP